MLADSDQCFLKKMKILRHLSSCFSLLFEYKSRVNKFAFRIFMVIFVILHMILWFFSSLDVSDVIIQDPEGLLFTDPEEKSHPCESVKNAGYPSIIKNKKKAHNLDWIL